MRLHEDKKVFNNLIAIVAREKHLPEQAIRRDYYITEILLKLSKSEYAEECVFKGGTSLSKCYPGSIERFSEDIDLTYLGMNQKDRQCDKKIKKIEQSITEGFSTEKIDAERSNRNKSMFVWFDSIDDKIKLEIGSNVRPDPYSKRTFKTYIHEYLEEKGYKTDIEEYQLEEVSLNVLNIERTFIDKVMSVKRHVMLDSIEGKVRHIYDVVQLMKRPEITSFLENREELKRLLKMTKESDHIYLEKRNISSVSYDPTEKYDFLSWKDNFNTKEVRKQYEKLHEDLLYTDEKQNFDDAIECFEKINKVFEEIDE